ncbi:MAG: thiamine phosphate synthase [Candidatus Acidiferrales bacterium]
MVLCYVTDRHQLNEAASLDELLPCVACAAAAGVDWIQIREKDVSARELVDFTRDAVAAVHREAARSKTRPARVFVNDRIDVALAAGAAGVHLSSASIPAAEVINWLQGSNALGTFTVGASCHGLGETLAAEKAGASYVFFGPVYETPSKLSFGKPHGVEKLAEVCRSIHIPVLAIGGVTEANAPACIRAGASGIAGIRMFQQATDWATLAASISRLRALD